MDQIQRLGAIMLMMRDLQVSADLKLREHSGQLNKTVLLPAAGCQYLEAGGVIKEGAAPLLKPIRELKKALRAL